MPPPGPSAPLPPRRAGELPSRAIRQTSQCPPRLRPPLAAALLRRRRPRLATALAPPASSRWSA
eukprot:2775768-Alexandrium_andersonii.AAC.1